VSVPLVSVVTPTWQRPDLLLNRCVPSVAAQTHWPLEHVVVSDGPDPALREKLAGLPVRFTELPEHDPAARWGHWARLHGTDVAKGEYITYLDDDDAYRPEHVSVLAAALDAHPDAAFAYSRMIMHTQHGSCRIGTDPPGYGQIGVPAIMHRRGLLDVATWEQSEPTIDWDLVSRWLDAGVNYTSVAADTVDIWPSLYR
jgi:glycosyltransferase involved in cell wall biosynthesis